MWRINNIMLAIVLAGTLVLGGIAAIESISWRITHHNDRSAQIARTLNAEGEKDEQGRKIRVQTISYDALITDEKWGPWSLVRIEQTALKDSVLLAPESSQLGALSADYRSDGSSLANNLVLRNSDTGTEKILFDQQTAIVALLKISKSDSPGVVVAYAHDDTNSDGKISRSDAIQIAHFNFATGARSELIYDGFFQSFHRFEPNKENIYFSAYLDLDRNGEIEPSFEPLQLIEASLSTSAVQPVIGPKTIDQLQATIDGIEAH